MGAAKKRRPEEAKRKSPRKYPWPLDGVGAFLDSFSPPTGDFDLNGSWEQTYAICFVDSNLSPGFLDIERTATSRGASITLGVESVIAQKAGGTQQIKAKLQCASDALSTPQSWQFESSFLGPDEKPVSNLRIEKTATVKAGVIETRFGTRTHTRKIALPFTSNWSLFDAVQRLPGKEMAPLQFTLLEDLDLVKENQRLSFLETTELKLADKLLRLFHYEQIGEGILPYHYYVDEQHRLLFAICGARAYLYDPTARQRQSDGKPRAGGRIR